MPRYTPPAAEPASPAVPDQLAAHEDQVATDEGRGVDVPVLDDGSEAAEDWFEVADDEVAVEADERTEVPAEPAVLTPSLFNGLSGIEAIAPTADPDTSPRPQASELDPYAWPDPRMVVAEVLERLAARVRDGDLALPTDIPASTDEAALAAVLSALVRSASQ
jgi:hypothetical protein